MSVLTFLAAFKCEANNNGIFEGMARLVLPYFLTYNARIAYDNALHVDATNDS